MKRIISLMLTLAVALSRMAMTVKMLRSSILDEMNKDYICTAFSRGRTRVDALKKHALRNAMIPVIAFNYGSGDKERVRAGIRWGVMDTLVIMGGVWRCWRCAPARSWASSP